MPRIYCCPHGHRWDENATPHADATCPECGAPGAEAGEATSGSSTIPGSASSSDVRQEQLPPALADFKILGVLGHGGMGVVYKAVQVSANRTVALKVIRRDRLQHEEAVRRFRREAQAAARLRHPNIVRVYDSDHSGDTHYLVMEYVDGITLERLVEQDGPLPVERACDFIRQAALGLQHAKDKALVHRDVKPANLMVTPPLTELANRPATGSQVKILDMGVARLLQLGGPLDGESLSTLTQGGAVIGTADYIAPEQLEDPHGADIRADLYSLGCTFYFLLTGQVPFPGGSLVSKLDKQRWETPISVRQLRPEIPAGVAAIVQRLMAKKPAERFAAPVDVARAIEELARTGYSGAAGVSTARPTRSFAATSPVWALACAPDGKWLFSAGNDGIIRVWDIAAGALLREFTPQAHEIRALALAADGQRICTAAGVSLRIWDVAGQELRRLAGHTATVRAAVFFPGGDWVISGGDDKTVRIWELASGRELQRLVRHTAPITGIAVSSDGERAISASKDQTLRVWDVRGGHEVRKLSGDGDAVLHVALILDGRFALSAHFDTAVRLWDLEQGQEMRRFIGHRQMVTAIAPMRDGRRFLSASQDQTVRLWDLEKGCELLCLEGHRGGVHAVAISPDGSWAFSAGADGMIHVWELGGHGH